MKLSYRICLLFAKVAISCLAVISTIFFTYSCKKEKANVSDEVPVQEVATVFTPSIQSEPTLTLQTNDSPNEGFEIGDIAWDLNLKDSNGVFVKLSSLRGKIILLDFWASWCAPCRFQNRHLKEVYPRYKDTLFADAKGFEIYMVSVFDKGEPWLKRLRVEQYNWKYNLFDEGGAAEWRYNVKFIPVNFLINQNGIIIARDLRDSLVEKSLNELLKK